MSRSKKLSHAVVTVVALSIPGCAGNSLFSSKDQGAAAGDSAALAKAAQSSQAGASPSAWKKATDAVSGALKIEPKEVPAPDATNLASGKDVGPEVHMAAARLHETQGDSQGAAVQYQKALRADPKNLTALVSYARLHDREGRFDQAAELYQRAIAAHPQSAMVRNDLGLCLFRQGDTAAAIHSLEKAVQLDPKKKLYRNNLAKALVGASRVDDAWRHLSAAHEPHIAHYNLAYLLRDAGQSAAAEEHLNQALALQPGFAEASQMLAQLQGKTSPQDDAGGEQETAVAAADSEQSPSHEGSPASNHSIGPANWRMSDDMVVQRTPAIENDAARLQLPSDLQMPQSSELANQAAEPAPTPDQFPIDFGAARVSHLPPVESSTR